MSPSYQQSMGRAPGRDVPFCHRMDITRYVYVPMHDGVRLAADIYRPKASGAYPCLLVQTPYNKNNFDAETAGRYVAAGYVLCVTDVRGAGGSEGELTYYNIPVPDRDRPDHPEPQEFAGPFDGADMVEWLASREFSNGKVGTFGGSALGIAQLLTARGRPDHLEAMFIQAAPVNYYIDRWFPGGIHNLSSTVAWQDGMTERIGVATPLEDVSRLPGEIDPEGDEIRRRVSLERLRLRGERSREGRWTALLERFFVLRNTPEFGGIWREYDHAPFLETCEIPTHYTGVWYDHFVRGSCESFVRHQGPKALTVQPSGQGVHGDHADVDMAAEHLRWFDRWLKGVDDGAADEPPVRLFVMGSEEWRGFDGWPPPGVEERVLSLSSGGELTPGEGSPFEDVLEHKPADPVMASSIADVRECEERSLTYTTPPLEEDLTVIGEPKLKLTVRCTSADGHLFIRLCDVFPEDDGSAGRSRQVTNGRLRLALRESFDKDVPVTPGEATPVEIDLWPVANAFKAGHRVRVVIASSEAPTAEVYPEACDITISEPSAIELPVLP